MKIKRIGSSGKGYGGNVYESYIDRLFAGNPNYEVVRYEFRLKGPLRIFEVPLFLFFCWKISRNNNYFVIRNFNTAFFPLACSSNGCTIVYHIDETGSRPLVAIFQKILEKAFFLQLRRADNLIVIAEYWKKYFADRGYNKTWLIYCPFEIEKYLISEAQVNEFKKRHFLIGKPIIYLGNPQEKKGFMNSYNAAKAMDAFLVSSGEGEYKTLGRHLQLSFQDYLILLKASDIVLTMSIFKEGWCRVAHEALLLGTPVIGSGQGGMSEILQKGGGIICEKNMNLPVVLKDTLAARTGGPKDQLFLRSFTVEKFKFEFQKVLSLLGALGKDQ